MPSPLNVKRNNYHAHPKRSDIYTPVGVAQFLHDVLQHGLPLKRQSGPCGGGGRCQHAFHTIFDPAIGNGRLTEPWRHSGRTIIGCDVIRRQAECRHYYCQQYETLADVAFAPDLVLCNPPFNGASGRRLYPEVFLAHTFQLFGAQQPIVLFAPMGMRLNQRRKSTRWRWLRDCGAKLTSIVSLPLDTFPNVEFHAEILIFNVRRIEPHYFLTESAV
jgi:hypothetical protein